MEIEKPFPVILKEGWFMKQGGRIKTWKRRWVVLGERSVKYFQDESYSVLKGFFNIDANSSVAIERTQKSLLLKVFTTNRDYCMVSDNENELQGWQIAFRKALDNLRDPTHIEGYDIEPETKKMSQLFPPKKSQFVPNLFKEPIDQEYQKPPDEEEVSIEPIEFKEIGEETKNLIFSLIHA